MEWRIHLRRNGYVVFPGLCPQPAVYAVRAAIDQDLATKYDAQRQLKSDNRSYCSQLRGTAVLLSLLLGSGIAAKLNEVIGFDKLGYDGGQIVIRKAGNARQPTEPGDAVLCHFSLAHAAAFNLSAFARYAVYFRLWLKDIEQRRWHLTTHIWDGLEMAGTSPT